MRPAVFQVGGTLYWTLLTRNPDTGVLKDADSTPSIAVRKNGASVGDSVTITKRSATTGIYDCSYNPAAEVEGDSFTFEESATVTGTTTSSATYNFAWNVRTVRTGAVELDSASVTAVQSGLATSAALTTVGSNVTAILEDTGTTIPAQISGLNNLSSAQVASALGTGTWATAIPWNASWDAEVQSEVQDAITSSNLASLDDIIAGVQSVSGAIIEAQNSATLSIRIGDTWTQDIESLGDLTDKTVSFALKRRASDADTAAIVFITEGTGLTRLNGAVTTAGWGSITILDEVAGDIRLRLESDATSLLTSGSYVDAVKVLEDGDDRTLRNAGRTVVSVGVIADIT